MSKSPEKISDACPSCSYPKTSDGPVRAVKRVHPIRGLRCTVRSARYDYLTILTSCSRIFIERTGSVRRAKGKPMSHDFTSGLSVHEVPWHGLGEVLDDYPESWAEARKIAGLEWEPAMEPVYAKQIRIVDGEPVQGFETI